MIGWSSPIKCGESEIRSTRRKFAHIPARGRHRRRRPSSSRMWRFVMITRPRSARMAFLPSKSLSASVMPARRTASMWERNSCVMGNSVGVCPVLAHQEPPGQPDIYGIMPVCDCRLRNLHGEDMGKLQKRFAGELGSIRRHGEVHERSRATHDLQLESGRSKVLSPRSE